ncbi:hypothetical protein NKW53_05935 [Acetobacter orientalis]|uniref:hypothetical protein n=1 Tax=Acetobacter orientalis TaxID=146474 RepID=UPI00209EBCED|nr:hypothetical protein [Acetobacter orientalis]MCP1215606.1 hypothetical protein [Acetobacter orientalis]MCP1217541.1 hypothetical protein [Acetobacter orientalis]
MKIRILLLAASFIFPAKLYAQDIVHAKRADTIGCTTPDTLQALKREIKGATPLPGWEERIQSLGCYLVATDLNWKVASQEGAIEHLQLDMEGVPMPALWFETKDMVKGGGAAPDQ